MIIPTCNGEETLGEALTSVTRQTFREMEVLVCDDGSKDRSRRIARDILEASQISNWRIVELRGVGAGRARNEGIAASKGEFIAFLDDDDAWVPEKLARCIAELDGNRLDLVCHSEIWKDSHGRQWERRYSELFDDRVAPIVSLMRSNPFSTSAVVVRREHLNRAGGFDESLPSAEDYDLWIRLALLPGFRFGFIDQPLGVYALREGSESSKVERRLNALLAIGSRYRDILESSSPWGRLEYHKYRGKTYFTSGVRFAMGGEVLRGVPLALKGLAMWPFRADLLASAVRATKRRREGTSG